VSDAAPASTAAAPAAAQLPPGDKPPRSERSGAAKRKRAKAAGGAKAPTAGAALNAEVRKLQEQLTALLVSPAVPMHMAEDHWPADHIENRAPELAHQIAELARRNAAFRAQLQRLLAASEGGQLFFAAAAYLLPVLIYYGLVPAPPMLKEQLQVPDRGAARAGVVPDWQPPVGSEDGSTQARPGAFAEQPPGTAGAAPAPAPGAAAPDG
jgi:hypothetical protein